VNVVCPLGRFELGRVHLEMIGDMDPADHQDLVFGLDFTDRFRGQIAFTSWDIARLQRASEGSGQSTGSGSNHVIQCRGMWRKLVEIVLVPFGDLGVSGEINGFLFHWKVGPTVWPFDAFDAHIRTVDDLVCHNASSVWLPPIVPEQRSWNWTICV
jgi:hypothetical protein